MLRDCANGLVSVLLAPQCAACHAILATPLSGCVCRNCWTAIRLITPPICDACGDPLARHIESRIWSAESRQPSICRQCAGRERIIEKARAVGEYEGALREIIHAFKYANHRSLAFALAGLIRQHAGNLLHNCDCVVPVPLHWRRERARGFNQARELARYLTLPVVEPLVRVRATVPQVALAADRRRTNLRGAFSLRRRCFGKPLKLDGLKVALIDDVSTTGATLEACAVVLKDAGVAEVHALTAARVPNQRP
jgi:ComF family protein